jgi:hypothetical protein
MLGLLAPYESSMVSNIWKEMCCSIDLYLKIFFLFELWLNNFKSKLEDMLLRHERI